MHRLVLEDREHGFAAIQQWMPGLVEIGALQRIQHDFMAALRKVKPDSLVLGEAHPLPQRMDTQIAVLYLATVGSVGLFGLILFVIGRWRVSAASYALVVAPLVAVSLGALLRGEPIGFAFVVGAVIVAAGVYVGALAGSGGRREAEAG